MSSLPRTWDFVDAYGRKLINGYFWVLSNPMVPPLPQWVVMTDRFNGDLYVLTHTGEDEALTISLSSTLPTTKDVTFYGPYDGPYVVNDARLYINEGVLMQETASNHANQRIFTRRGLERTFLELTVPVDTIVYTPLTV